MKLFIKIKKWLNYDQNIRLLVQLSFLILILWIGFEFYSFIKYYATGGQTPFFNRPPGVEGFLPISSLMGLRNLFLTGNFNMVHPAGIILVSIFLLFAIFLKNGFCGWICPVGFFSEYLGKLGNKIFGKNLILPKWLDYPLQSLKYLLLLFFLWAIFAMPVQDLQNFLNGDYNKIADVNMLMFFIHLSVLSIVVIAILIILSVFINRFWCKYLCPYGALLGFLSIFSPLKVTRNQETCTNCQSCTKVCPSNIQVHKKIRIRSDECMSCAKCITACPEEDTLKFRLSKQSKRSISIKVYAYILVATFVIITGLAMLTNLWKSNVNSDVYNKMFNKTEYRQ